MGSVVQEENRARNIMVSCSILVDLWVPSTPQDTHTLVSLWFPCQDQGTQDSSTHACWENDGTKWKATLLSAPLFNFLSWICCVSEAQSEDELEHGNKDHLQLINDSCCNSQIKTCISERTFFSSCTSYVSYWAPRTTLFGLYTVEKERR